METLRAGFRDKVVSLRYIIDFLRKKFGLYFVKRHSSYDKYDFGRLPCLNRFFILKNLTHSVTFLLVVSLRYIIDFLCKKFGLCFVKRRSSYDKYDERRLLFLSGFLF